MKKIKEIRIEVTYTVSYKDVEVSDDFYERLETAYDYGTIIVNSNRYSDVVEWIVDNVKEKDADDWTYKIDELEIDEDENN
jgi:hypothetical protein